MIPVQEGMWRGQKIKVFFDIRTISFFLEPNTILYHTVRGVGRRRVLPDRHIGNLGSSLCLWLCRYRWRTSCWRRRYYLRSYRWCWRQFLWCRCWRRYNRWCRRRYRRNNWSGCRSNCGSNIGKRCSLYERCVYICIFREHHIGNILWWSWQWRRGTSAVGSPWTFGAGGGASDGLNVSDIDPITDELLDVSEGNVDEVGGIDGANDSDRTSFC